MKKIKFLNKMTDIEKEILVGEVGENVYAICKDVNEVNDAIRWCNLHNVGDKFECESYSMEITKNKL